MDIKITLLVGKNYHKDLFIKIGKHEELADTYYFWRDEFSRFADPYVGIKKSLLKYLSCWACALEKLKPSGTVFIPINFSDEYIGGFSVKSVNEHFDLIYGYIYDIQNQIVRVSEDECYTNLDKKEIDTIIKFKLNKKEFISSLRLT